jgi:stringent starvation protein B
VLNLSAGATHRLTIDNDWIQFAARFGGVSQEVAIPMAAVAGIFARETGYGLAFQVAPAAAPSPSEAPPEAGGGQAPKGAEAPSKPRPKLSVVK